MDYMARNKLIKELERKRYLSSRKLIRFCNSREVKEKGFAPERLRNQAIKFNNECQTLNNEIIRLKEEDQKWKKISLKLKTQQNRSN